MSREKKDRQISARVPGDLWEFVEREAYLEGVSKSAVLVRALESYRKEVADPDEVRERMAALRDELKHLEMKLPDYYQRLEDRRKAAADRETEKASEDPVQDALDEIAEAFENSGRRAFEPSHNRSWLASRVANEPSLKGSADKHVRALTERLGLEQGGGRRP